APCQAVTHFLQPAHVEDARAPGRRDAPVQAAPGVGRREGVCELALEPGGLVAQRAPGGGLVGAGAKWRANRRLWLSELRHRLVECALPPTFQGSQVYSLVLRTDDGGG